MRLILILLTIFYSFVLSAQQFVLEKGKDTLRSKPTALDTITVAYKLAGLEMHSTPKIQIKHTGGTAKKGTDFNLFDAYNSPTNQIDISKVHNLEGTFKVEVGKNITELKTINLQIFIGAGAAPPSDIVKLIIAPLSKKPDEEPKKPESKESIEFFVYNETKVTVFIDDNNALKGKKDDVKVDVSKSEITQKGKQDYRFRVTTTDNEIYYATLKLTTQYEFMDDDKLYLRGKAGNVFIHARDIFLINHIVESDKTKTPEENSIKFKL